MGATYMRAGGLKRNTVGKWADKIFGIPYAIRFQNMAPREANFDKPSTDNVQMSVATLEGEEVLFQFRLTRNEALQIKGYDPNVSTTAKAIVDRTYPSLDVVIKEGRTLAERVDAQRLKDIMGRTMAGVSIESLSKLANELVRRKNRRRR